LEALKLKITFKTVYLGLHLITIYRLIKKGELPSFKIGGQWRFKKDLLDAWIAGKINSGGEKK